MIDKFEYFSRGSFIFGKEKSQAKQSFPCKNFFFKIFEVVFVFVFFFLARVFFFSVTCRCGLWMMQVNI